VITGASTGIGRAVAELAAADGAAVVLSARRADLLDEAAAGIARLPKQRLDEFVAGMDKAYPHAIP
jgi:NADP-dependent 3-hydroxy acid dehydrogenase YdfG